MLTRPDLADERIVACLRERYGRRAVEVTHLPIGADVNSAKFRVATADGARYFLKLSPAARDDLSVAVAGLLYARGVRRVVAPIASTSGELRVLADGYDWRLYPCFAGTSGLKTALSRAQWIRLGETVRAVHATTLPSELSSRLPRETFGPEHRALVRALDEEVQRRGDDDPVAAELAAYWLTKRDEVRCILGRADALARALSARPAELVLCHGDLHGGNILVGAGDELAIVDWDEPTLAPKERDLMFIGGGVGGCWNRPDEAEWFYEGYGQAEVDRVALAYYRYERIVVDLAEYGGRILGAVGSAPERAEDLRQFAGAFLPGNVVEMAHRSYSEQE